MSSQKRATSIDYSKYHPNFKKRGPTCIKRANYTCQICGRKRGEEYITVEGKPRKIVIHAHHPNYDKMNPRAKLVALCEVCHRRIEGEHTGLVRRQQMQEAEIQAGQMTLPGFYEKREKRGQVNH